MFWVPLCSHSSSPSCWTHSESTQSGMRLLRISKRAAAEHLTQHGPRSQPRPPSRRGEHNLLIRPFARAPTGLHFPARTLGAQPRPVKATVSSVVSLVHGPKLQLPEPICSPCTRTSSRPETRNLPLYPCCSRSMPPWAGASPL